MVQLMVQAELLVLLVQLKEQPELLDQVDFHMGQAELLVQAEIMEQMVHLDQAELLVHLG